MIAGQPAFYALILVRLAPHLSGRSFGADVACDTGLAGVALAEHVNRVLAFGTSAARLAHARPHPRVT